MKMVSYRVPFSFSLLILVLIMVTSGSNFIILLNLSPQTMLMRRNCSIVLLLMVHSPYIKRVAQIKGTWRDTGRWEECKMAEIYNSVKYIFDFDALNNKTRKYKQCEQNIWETIHGKIKEIQASIGWGRRIRVMNLKELITLWGPLINFPKNT